VARKDKREQDKEEEMERKDRKRIKITIKMSRGKIKDRAMNEEEKKAAFVCHAAAETLCE